MGTLTIDQVIKEIQQVPSLSVVVMEILASFDKEDIDVARLVQKLGQDQGLTARVLRVANSPFFDRSDLAGKAVER